MSVVLGNTDPGLFVEDTLVFVLTGGVGGVFGQMAAAMNPGRIRR
jgi:hypothetical protein